MTVALSDRKRLEHETALTMICLRAWITEAVPIRRRCPDPIAVILDAQITFRKRSFISADRSPQIMGKRGTNRSSGLDGLRMTPTARHQWRLLLLPALARHRSRGRSAADRSLSKHAAARCRRAARYDRAPHAGEHRIGAGCTARACDRLMSGSADVGVAGQTQKRDVRTDTAAAQKRTFGHRAQICRLLQLES